jgi:hypothetical protein
MDPRDHAKLKFAVLNSAFLQNAPTAWVYALPWHSCCRSIKSPLQSSCRRWARKNVSSTRANRAIVFSSALFHEIDRMHFREGYTNRRLNITMLYGRR